MNRLIPTPTFPGAERRRAPLARRLAGGWALGMALALMGATALHSPQAWAQAAPSPAAAPGADYADTAKRVAEYLYGTRRASSPEAATSQAWDIVFNNHWATAGTVRIPKIDKVPVADPTMVAAYGEYFRQNLDKFYLAVPAPGPATARLTEQQRLDQWKNHLKNYGAFTADRAETGVMFRDGEGIPVRGQNGQAFSTSWDAIKNDKEFMAWWQRTGSPAELRPGDPRSAAPDPAVEQMRRNRPKPPTRNDEPGGGDNGDENYGGGGEAFNPEGRGYDYNAARSAGMGPDGTGQNKGHWGSVREATDAERKRHGLPDEAYLILKGRNHETWDKAVQGEAERGFKIVKRGDRYWSVPKDWEPK